MGYITEIGLTSRFFQGKGAYQLVYHKNSGTLPLNLRKNCSADKKYVETKVVDLKQLISYYKFEQTLSVCVSVCLSVTFN